MFSLFGKKKNLQVRDCVWINKEGRDKAIHAWLADPSHIVSAWFNDEVYEFRKLMPEYASRIMLSSELSFHSLEEDRLVFAGIYPLPEVQASLAESLGFHSLTNYVSLDEPVMKIFGSEKIAAMMKQMGMKEDEMLEHKMISSAISNAQKKIAEKVTTELKANSEEEWFRLNWLVY